MSSKVRTIREIPIVGGEDIGLKLVLERWDETTNPKYQYPAHLKDDENKVLPLSTGFGWVTSGGLRAEDEYGSETGIWYSDRLIAYWKNGNPQKPKGMLSTGKPAPKKKKKPMEEEPKQSIQAQRDARVLMRTPGTKVISPKGEICTVLERREGLTTLLDSEGREFQIGLWNYDEYKLA